MPTQTDHADFLLLAQQGQIKPCLKSYCDTLLFFYLAYLASANKGGILEIGMGGSSFVLGEVSRLAQRRLHLVDIDCDGLQQITDSALFDQDLVTAWCMSSDDLPNQASEIGELIYCHVDGSKNYVTAKSDLEFCLEHLAPMGLVCQDDYGNNKWPSITILVHDLVQRGLASIVLIGDSSIWITKPEFHHDWLRLMDQDSEMRLLGHFVGLCSAKTVLCADKDYYFLNAMTTDHVYYDDQASKSYFDQLLELGRADYLRMPYRDQSSPGYFATKVDQLPPYILCQQHTWDHLRGDDWPPLAPQSRQQIDELPGSIKQEITQHHRIDLYAIDPFHSVFHHKKTNIT